jgi:hypothetical protein
VVARSYNLVKELERRLISPMEVIQEHHQRLPWLDTKIKENKRSGEPGKSESTA